MLCLGLQVMCMSENKILTQCFERDELSDKKRPDTVRNGEFCFDPLECMFPQHNRTAVCSAS